MALREFGFVESVKEECRDAVGWRWLEDLWRDVFFGGRVLRKHPGFTLAAALTLALGIGLNTAIFSVCYAVVFRPLPWKAPERVVIAFASNAQEGFPI